MGQVAVFSGPERRRRWSEEERLQLLSEAFAPGACVAEVCRRHDISSALGAARETEVPDAFPTPVFAEALIDGKRCFQPTCAWGRSSSIRDAG